MRTSERLTNRLKAVQDDAIEAIKDFFRESPAGIYEFDDPVLSTPNGSVTIKAIVITRLAHVSPSFGMIGEDENGTELEETDLSLVEVQDLVWALGELECKKYSYLPVEEVKE